MHIYKENYEYYDVLMLDCLKSYKGREIERERERAKKEVGREFPECMYIKKITNTRMF